MKAGKIQAGVFLLCAHIAIPAVVLGQPVPTVADRIARETDLGFPAAPAFTMLDVEPANVARPAFVEQFKLDLLIREKRLAPDLALALRPVWTFFYRNVGAASYRRQPLMQRALSTLTVSVGTAEDDSLRRLALAVTFNVIRKDPLVDTSYVRALSAALDVSAFQDSVAQAMATARIRFDRAVRDIATRTDLTADARDQAIQDARARFEEERAKFDAAARDIEADLTRRAREIALDWRNRHWNAPALDVGAGRLYEYDSARIDSLNLRGAGYGVWANAAYGFGTERWLLSTMGRYMHIAGQTRTVIGGNLRHGGPDLDFFVEYLFREASGADAHEIAYGGTYRADDSRNIEFGLRTLYDDGFDLRRLVPVVKLNWVLGKHHIENLVLRPPR